MASDAFVQVMGKSTEPLMGYCDEEAPVIPNTNDTTVEVRCKRQKNHASDHKCVVEIGERRYLLSWHEVPPGRTVV